MNNAVLILKREREAASEQAKALRVRIKQLDEAITLLERHTPTATGKVKAEMDMKTLVVEVLASNGNHGMYVKDIFARLVQSGRRTSEASVSSTLSRLKADNMVRNDRGMWSAAKQPAPLVSDEDACNADIDTPPHSGVGSDGW